MIKSVKERQSDMPKRMTDEIINAAIDGFAAQKARLNQQIAELRAMLNDGQGHSAATPESAPTKRRKFSAAARRRMREAQRQRWARIRKPSEPAGSAKRESKPKRRISKQGLKNIIAATKRRWALRRLEAARGKKASKKGAVKRAAKRVAA
jgi:hypothetical protein